MGWIILACILGLLIGIIIGYFIKRKVNRKINNKIFEEESTILNDYYEKINNVKKEYDNLQIETEKVTESFNKFTVAMKEAQERELKICYDNGLEEIKRKLLKADTELKANYQENKLKYDKEINEIKSELDLFKAARRAIIEDQKRQEAIEKEKNFYMLQVSENDKEDIKQLKTIEPKLNNKEVLNKLIFETYYRKPMTDMFGRVARNNKPCGIYKITNIKNKKIYIGKSVEIIPKRWTEHIKTSLDIGSISRTKIHEAMKEDGIENFTFEILEECQREKLSEREKYWIDFYETNTYGYNIKSGG